MILKSVVYNIINGKRNYCCLCLKILNEPAALLQDEIIFGRTYDSLEIIEILVEILGNSILYSLSPQSSVCSNCKKSSLESFLFVKRCKENCNNLAKIINSIYKSTETISSHICKSAFITFNCLDFSTQAYYETQRPVSEKSVLKRFQSTLNASSQFKVEIEENMFDTQDTLDIKNEDIYTSCQTEPVKTARVKKRYTKVEIPTSEMMCEGNSLKCVKCFRTYSSKQQLRQHFIRVHAPKKFPCDKCPRSYSTKALLDQHKYECHTPAICSECGKTYKNRFSLANHEQGHKTKIICPDCGRMYKTQKTFSKHLELKICQQKERKSNLLGKYICDHCEKKFSHKGTLRVHIKFEHGTGKPHECPWCSKKFNAESRLKAHIVKHTQEKKFFCNICSGKFVTKESLLYHTRIHTGEQPYACHLCEQKFISSSRRAAHIRRHMSVSYECEICHSKFKEKAWLLKHKKRHFNPKSRLHCSEKVAEINQ